MKTHARNTVNTNEFKDYIFHGNKPQTAKTLLFTAFLRNDFSKNTFFFDNFWLLKPPKTKRGGYPPTPFYILNFKIFTKSKTLQFLELKTRPEPHFLTVFTMFYARAWIFTPKNATSKIIKKSLKPQFPPGVLVFWAPAPCPKPTPPNGNFWRYLRCFMHIEHSSKKNRFCASGGGRRHKTLPL